MVGHRFEGDGRHAAVDHRRGQLRAGGQVEVGEQREVGPEVRPLWLQRLLDLDDHVGRPRVGRSGHDAPARVHVGVVVEASATTGL
jgi:hypothetical protein